MAFDITTTAGVVKTHINGTGDYFKADIGMPSGGRPQGPYAGIYPQSMSVEEVTLTTTVERHTLRIELHVSPTARTDQERVLEAARLTSEFLDLIYADYSLGGNVRAVDVAGIAVDFIDRIDAEVPTHVADITLPLIVDGTTAFAA